MVTNWPLSKDDIYGPPPAYSVHPPPPPSSIYAISELQYDYPERQLPSSREYMNISTRFLRYLLSIGILHILIGITTIVCDILLISMNESYSYPGLWAGVSCIILGIYLILFMSDSRKEKHSFTRFKLMHISICFIIIIALVLASINLTTNSCPPSYFEIDQCQNSAQKFKIILVTFFAFTFVQICITSIVTFVHIR